LSETVTPETEAPDTSDAPAPDDNGGFEEFVEVPAPGLVSRFFTTLHHMGGMLGGLLLSHVKARKGRGETKGLGYAIQWFTAAMVRPFIKRALRDEPFPVQFRRRLEILGPTYIKLGQILSLRQDILPEEITEELKNLLDRLPAVSYTRYLELIEEGLERPIPAMFQDVARTPVGSASIAQTHLATMLDGQRVILKVVKPGIATTLRRDAVLLRLFGRFLQIFLSRFQPQRVIDEFCAYTLREVDLRREADNAETFAANFEDHDGIVFPKIYRELTSESVLCMEFFDGIKPNDPRAQDLTPEDREKLIDYGAEAIIRMLYKDGFFHADLHPGNLLILPGPRDGFIDLGMVGRFDDQLRRTLLYYYYCLVMGDAENAARYLTSVADPAPGADPEGFRKEVEDVSRRWSRHANFAEFSLARLILESVGKAGKYRMYFPVEMVLMVKALVTFEGVGQILKPGFDVAEVSQRHINRIFFGQFNPLRLAKESLRGAPEVVDALVKAPLLITEGLKFLEQSTKPRENPLAGLRGTLMAGACLIAAAILIAFGQPWWLALPLFLLAVGLFLRKGP
jgi:ubiquinone biosynthesis protein